MVASALQKFSSQLQHLHLNIRGFHSNKELMPLPAGFSHNCFALVNPSRCSRNPDFAQASEVCRGFKPQQCPLLYPMGTQGWVHISQHKETQGFTSADKPEGLARWRSKEPPQANAGLKPSSTNICCMRWHLGTHHHCQYLTSQTPSACNSTAPSGNSCCPASPRLVMCTLCHGRRADK